MQAVETLALSFPAMARVPTFVFNSVTSWGNRGLNQKILAQFRKPSGWWGRLFGNVMRFEHAPITKWALDLLAIAEGDRVLDAGCGSGGGVGMMLRSKAACVAGIDYSTAMVDESRSRHARAVVSGRCQIRQGNIAQLPFPDGTFDRIASIETMYFWSDPVRNFIELHRALAPGGKASIVLAHTRDGKNQKQMDLLERDSGLVVYSPQRVADLMREAGFAHVRVEYRADNKWLYVEGTR